MSTAQRAPAPAPPGLVATQPALAALCDRLRQEPWITIDTEFMRERTYYSELCLVQLAGHSEVAIIDAQAPGLDLAPLGALLADTAVLKVFHAARQDVEIFLQLFGALPTPLFDTQVAAMVAGFGDQVGYDVLVQALTGGTIDKAHRFSDWSARPLSPSQLTYAAADVTHLRTVYERLRTRLDQNGRAAWVAEEMAILDTPTTYRPEPDTMWERLRPRATSRRLNALRRAAAAWREREAQRIDIPRQRLLKDESLLEIAATNPTTPEALARIRGISRGFAEGRGASLLTALAEAAALPEDACPTLPRTHDGPRPSPALVALLRVLLAAKSEEHDVAPKLLASSEDLDRLATEDTPDIPAMHGWRHEVYGADARALKAGHITLGVNGKRIKLVRI